MRRALTCLLLLSATIPLGIVVRFAPLHLPWFWAKYLGSMLWAVAVYWLVAAVLFRLRPFAVAALAATIAILVELSRLTPQPQVDAFRLTLAGRLLLGRFFSVWNIAAYLLAIALTAAADHRFKPGYANA